MSEAANEVQIDKTTWQMTCNWVSALMVTTLLNIVYVVVRHLFYSLIELAAMIFPCSWKHHVSPKNYQILKIDVFFHNIFQKSKAKNKGEKLCGFSFRENSVQHKFFTVFTRQQ